MDGRLQETRSSPAAEPLMISSLRHFRPARPVPRSGSGGTPGPFHARTFLRHRRV